MTKLQKKIEGCLKLIIKACIQEIHRKFSRGSKEKDQTIYFSEQDIYELPTPSLINKILDNPELVQNIKNNSLCRDVFTFRNLLMDLLHLDCVRFYQ